VRKRGAARESSELDRMRHWNHPKSHAHPASTHFRPLTPNHPSPIVVAGARPGEGWMWRRNS
jgi:hypothetical protein